jgi:hypothetical protein
MRGPMLAREKRIRELAYKIWLEENRPEGRDKAHWDMAEKIVGPEDEEFKVDGAVLDSHG